MTTMTNVYVMVNRPASIIRGINGTDSPVQVPLDVSAMTDAQREAVAAHYVQESRASSYRPEMLPHYPRLVQTPGYIAALVVDEPTQEGVLRALEEADLAAEAKAAAKHEQELREVAERDAVTAALAAVDTTGIKVNHYTARRVHLEIGSLKEIHIEAHEIAEAVARLRARKAERDSEQAAKLAARDSWIAAYGSDRLRTLAAEGIQHDATYQAERAAHEQAEFDERLASIRPGWVEVEESEIDRRVADCTASELEILRAARAMAPSCVLVEYEGEVVACEEFHGRLIVWPN